MRYEAIFDRAIRRPAEAWKRLHAKLIGVGAVCIVAGLGLVMWRVASLDASDPQAAQISLFQASTVAMFLLGLALGCGGFATYCQAMQVASQRLRPAA